MSKLHTVRVCRDCQHFSAASHLQMRTVGASIPVFVVLSFSIRHFKYTCTHYVGILLRPLHYSVGILLSFKPAGIVEHGGAAARPLKKAQSQNPQRASPTFPSQHGRVPASNPQ